jgi:hypothetical protein
MMFAAACVTVNVTALYADAIVSTPTRMALVGFEETAQ